MKTPNIRKLIGLAGLASLTLLATGVQAGHGYPGHPGHPGHYQGGPNVEYRQHSGPGPRREDMNIEQRQRHLMARVEQGLRNGRLTHYEARELFQDLRRSEFLERRFEADGRLNRAEWAELDRVLDRIARDLRHGLRHELRHGLRDDDRRGGGPGWGYRGYAWR